MAELVIACLLVGVAEYAVCLCRLLELFLGFLVARVLVGVILDGQLAVGLLYVVCRCVPADTQHFIVISLCHINSLSDVDPKLLISGACFIIKPTLDALTG